MPKPYAMLRGLMAQHDADLDTLAKVIGLQEKSAVSHRMMNHTPWKADEMYKILDFFKVPHDSIHIYFPKDGKNTITQLAPDYGQIRKQA